MSYWGLVITTFVIYFITTDEDSYSSMLVASVGILIGYGLSLRSISKWHYVPGMFSVYHIGSVILSYAMLAILVAAIPTINFNDTTKIVSGILKSGLLIFMIFSTFPYLQKAIARRKNNKFSSKTDFR